MYFIVYFYFNTCCNIFYVGVYYVIFVPVGTIAMAEGVDNMLFLWNNLFNVQFCIQLNDNSVVFLIIF